MTKDTLKYMYENNVDFRNYIDKYCRCKLKIKPDGAFNLKIIQEVANAYWKIEQEKGK